MPIITNYWRDQCHPSIRYQDSVLTSIAYLLAIAVLTGCSNIPQAPDSTPSKLIVRPQATLSVPQREPKSRYGNPDKYCVNGICYHTLATADGYHDQGIASWYGPNFHGHLTSNREVYNMYGMTAAHKTLPLPCCVRVSNLRNNRSVIVRVNDRGPFHADRIIDLSRAAAAQLGILQNGTGMVEVTAVDTCPSPSSLLTESQQATTFKPTPNNGTTPRLFLQLGAFGDRSNAERMAAKIPSSLSSAVRIQPLQAPEPVYRVQLGPIDSVARADDLTIKLRQLGIVGIADTKIIVE